MSGSPYRTLSEFESKQLLERHGVAVAPQRLATTPDEAVAAASDLGFPVVVKLTGDAIAHKTERGLVRLGLATPDAVAAAATDLLAAARPDDGEVALLVAPMVRGSRELIAGLHTDAQFGPCVMLGIGGVLAEAVADVVFRLVPIDESDAREMIDSLRGQALLGPFRGEPAVDRDALVATLVALSRPRRAGTRVVSVDVNPLVVAGGVPIAVDGLVELAPEGATPGPTAGGAPSRARPFDRRLRGALRAAGGAGRRCVEPPGQVRLRRAAQHPEPGLCRARSTGPTSRAARSSASRW